MNNNPYLWARNLAANRGCHCRVVFTEPYVTTPQHCRKYAKAVADGLAEAVAAGRRPQFDGFRY